MNTEFSKTLKKLLEEAGFRTAYSFFHDNGGRAVFCFSYRMYLAMEDGHKLPPFKAMPLIVHGLRLVALSEPATRLVSAWLAQKLGADAFKLLLEPLLKEPPPPSISSPLHKVIKKSLSDRKVYITPEQASVLAKNKANYLCWLSLSNDSGKWKPAALAKKLGISRAAAENALSEFHRARLLKRTSDGAYRCPFTGLGVEYPRPNVSEAVKRLRKLQNELVESGEEVYQRRGILRADFTEFANYIPMLALTISAVVPYAVTKSAKHTALFSVESRVVKISNF